MCTAVTYQTRDFYFGRTLDHSCAYGEEITITPRKYPFYFRHRDCVREHYAMIGMAHIREEYPLYYEAVNEKGLAIAGLNFVGNAYYGVCINGKDNLAPFELIPWILGTCANVGEAKGLLERLQLVRTPFSQDMPLAQLHWMIADREEAITVESVETGLFVYENPVGVLTNNPPFLQQLFQLNNYMHLSAKAPVNRFSPQLPLETYSLGMGALGLPGDLSSQSRFVRAAFMKLNSVSKDSEAESVNQFFHIMGTVDQPRGISELGKGLYETTLYTSCCNADKGIYYYTTYGNHQISAVRMQEEKLDDYQLIRYPLIGGEQIHMQN